MKREERKEEKKIENKMMRIFFVAVICMFLAVPVFTQEQEDQRDTSKRKQEDSADSFLAAPSEKGDLWIGLSAETALYSAVNLSYGAGFALAYGRQACIGFKAAFFWDAGGGLDVLELDLLLRYYLQNILKIGSPVSGPFLQFTGGPSLYFDRNNESSASSALGRLSAGLSFGWRFIFGNHFFAEPSIRGGYPYIVGVSLAAGARF